jgi:hypothetical protein
MIKYPNLFPGEEVVLEITGWYVKSFMNAKTGVVIVTNKRVGFVEVKQVVGGGALAAAAAMALDVAKPKLLVDLPFDQLSIWEHPKKNDIKFISKTGEGYAFRAVPYDEWNKKLEELTGKQGK